MVDATRVIPSASFAILVAAGLAGCISDESPPSPDERPPAQPLVFVPPTTVQQTGPGGAEPAVSVHPDGTLYVLVWTQLHRSTDGGRTFTRLSTPFKNNGDSDLEITPDGVLHYVGMSLVGQAGEPRMPYYRSTDKGDTWSQPVDLAKAGNSVDRQFLTYGAGLLVLTWNDLVADENLVRVSHDQGKTWSEPHELRSPRARTVGAAAIWEKAIVQPLNLHERLLLARSDDVGASWNIQPGPAINAQAEFMPQVAFDQAGTLYLAATLRTSQGPAIHVWSSHDAGTTWSAPLRLHDDSSHSIFPWIVAAAPGRVAVSMYERDVRGGAANAPWYPSVAFTNHADQGSGWRLQRVVEEPVRTQDICSGDGCSQELWNFKDLFEMTTTSEGRPFLAWMKETRTGGTPLPLLGGGSTLTVHATTATGGWAATG